MRYPDSFQRRREVDRPSPGAPPDLSPALLETQSAAERIKAIVRDLQLFSQVE